jgi:hypothetical protein
MVNFAWFALGIVSSAVLLSDGVLVGFRLGMLWKTVMIDPQVEQTVPVVPQARWNPGDPLNPISMDQQTSATAARDQILRKLAELRERDE